MSETFTTTYLVDGMTCAHCVASVTAAVGGLDGVTDVAVDLERGSVTLAATRPPDITAVRAAVADAGYEVRP